MCYTTKQLKGVPILVDVGKQGFSDNPCKATITKVVNAHGHVRLHCHHEYGYGFCLKLRAEEVQAVLDREN